MSYAVPAFRWAGLRDGADHGRPAVEVPAALSALGPRERALLEARLTVRCRVPAVRVAPDGREAVRIVGPTADRVSAAFRRLADDAIRTVSADAAAGWTAADELERHRPFTWDPPVEGVAVDTDGAPADPDGAPSPARTDGSPGAARHVA